MDTQSSFTGGDVFRLCLHTGTGDRALWRGRTPTLLWVASAFETCLWDRNILLVKAAKGDFLGTGAHVFDFGTADIWGRIVLSGGGRPGHCGVSRGCQQQVPLDRVPLVEDHPPRRRPMEDTCFSGRRRTKRRGLFLHS